MHSDAGQTAVKWNATAPHHFEPGPLVFRNLTEALPAFAETALSTTATSLPVMDRVEAMEAARAEGRNEAAAAMQVEVERRLRAERQNVTLAVEAFLSEKKRYFAGLEKEVVRLSLAIAERVLHRESAMDPLLLAGAARVALEQVDEDSAVTLLVAPGEAGPWRASSAKLEREVLVREDATLAKGECLLQTEAGSFELGLRAQLCEIERGFYELLSRTPVAAA